MLKVPCGISGKVRIVKENSITGEVTHDESFCNIWTDYGLNYLSSYTPKIVGYPNYIQWGSGAHTEPHSAVTTLVNRIGSGYVSFNNLGGVTYDSSVCTVTRTVSTTQAATGSAWVLREIGLNATPTVNSNMMTYTLVKNSAGVPDPVSVSAIEIITIYYTIQLQYPMTLPPQAVTVVGLPPTTAKFILKPATAGFAAVGITTVGNGNYLAGYTSENFAGRETATTRTETTETWGIKVLNRTTEFFGQQYACAAHVWQLDPPIIKNNTQELKLEIFWQFANATPVEVAP